MVLNGKYLVPYPFFSTLGHCGVAQQWLKHLLFRQNVFWRFTIFLPSLTTLCSKTTSTLYRSLRFCLPCPGKASSSNFINSRRGGRSRQCVIWLFYTQPQGVTPLGFAFFPILVLSNI